MSVIKNSLNTGWAVSITPWPVEPKLFYVFTDGMDNSQLEPIMGNNLFIVLLDAEFSDDTVYRYKEYIHFF